MKTKPEKIKEIEEVYRKVSSRFEGKPVRDELKRYVGTMENYAKEWLDIETAEARQAHIGKYVKLAKTFEVYQRMDNFSPIEKTVIDIQLKHIKETMQSHIAEHEKLSGIKTNIMDTKSKQAIQEAQKALLEEVYKHSSGAVLKSMPKGDHEEAVKKQGAEFETLLINNGKKPAGRFAAVPPRGAEDKEREVYNLKRCGLYKVEAEGETATYEKQTEGLSYNSEGKDKLDRAVVKKMLEHAQKIGYEPVSISGDARLVKMAAEICEKKGINYHKPEAEQALKVAGGK
jgi:hypothetical protein